MKRQSQKLFVIFFLISVTASARLEMARKWRDAVNKRGGDVTVIHLPEVGIKGNTHFPFSDLNNLQVADLMSSWLTKKGLDKYSKRK